MADKDEKPLLQRRGGRRVSTPSSPISPTFVKRGERHHFHFIDSPAMNREPSGQPDSDITLATSNIDGSFLPSNTPKERGDTRLVSTHTATTEEVQNGRALDYLNSSWETTSSARSPEARQMQGPRPMYLAEMTSRSSPVISRASDSRDRALDTPVAAGRNYSTTSLSTERSASDENVLPKVPAAKKSRLNLLNPMSLLNRRRSSQNTRLEEINVNVTPLQVPAIPENFEPSIRGSFVHDFSTPRSKRSHFENSNSPRREGFSSPANIRRASEFGTPSTHYASSPSPALHSPLFREHFQEEDNALQPGQTAYLHNAANSRKYFDPPSPATLPSFAKNLPTILPEPEKITEQSKPLKIEVPHPENPPPPPPKQTPSPNLDLPPTNLPKHMNSVSSRFSFQIGEQGSSFQEKLLEEKHKEHFAKENDTANNEEAVIDDFDDYDFDADDDLEERIPGVNTDYFDDDGFNNDDIPTRNIELPYSQDHTNSTEPHLQGFHFTPSLTAFSPASPFLASEPTPRDNEGFAIGVANSKDSPTNPISGYNLPNLKDSTAQPLFLEGLRISTIEDDELPLYETAPPPDVTQRTFDDTDLYFDDGEFDMDLLDPDDQFDENLLDDESGQIRDIPAENAKRYEEALEKSAPGAQITAIDPNTIGLSRDTSSSSNFVGVRDYGSSGFSESREQELDAGFSTQTSILTEDNLAAYHDALAEAANYAAANGKFNRQVSFTSDISDDAEPIQTGASHNHPQLRSSHTANANRTEHIEEYGTFPFDDDGLDDDLMIAEANAEALENDDEGFYGQEFGFYARAHGKEISDQINGGFFAAHGSNGIKRSHSGKANFQEPSLTPITERSEWSTRNSVASLNFPGNAANASQPGSSSFITQRLDSASFEDEMTLSALMRLRRGAFGGSSTSINSLGERSMPGSSPLAHVSSYPFPAPEASHMHKQSNGSPMRIVESEEEDDYDGEQLTLTQNTPRKQIPGASPTRPYAQLVHLAVNESPKMGRKTHHRRNSSGADSVSYVRDADGHWVLERRRTNEDGAQEVVEREHLAGARI